MINKKVITVLAFFFLFLLLIPLTTQAFTDTAGPDASTTTTDTLDNMTMTKKCTDERFGAGVQEKIDKYKEDEASIPEKSLVVMVQTVTNIGAVNSISTLIYGNPYCLWAEGKSDYNNLVYGIFSTSEFDKIIKPAYTIFSGSFALFLTLAIMISTFKYSINLQNGRKGSDFALDVQMWFVSIFYLSFLWIFINIIFYINGAVVDSLFNLMKDNGINTNNFTVMTDLKYHNLTDIFLYIAEWALTVIMNFIYLGRKTILMLLVILAPLSAIALLFESSRKYFGIWLKTLISTVFINVIHGLVFYLIVMLDQVAGKNDSYIFKLILMIMYIPLTSMAVAWIGFTDTSSAGQKIGQTGASAIQKLGSLAKSKMKG